MEFLPILLEGALIGVETASWWHRKRTPDQSLSTVHSNLYVAGTPVSRAVTPSTNKIMKPHRLLQNSEHGKAVSSYTIKPWQGLMPEVHGFSIRLQLPLDALLLRHSVPSGATYLYRADQMVRKWLASVRSGFETAELCLVLDQWGPEFFAWDSILDSTHVIIHKRSQRSLHKLAKRGYSCQKDYTGTGRDFNRIICSKFAP